MDPPSKGKPPHLLNHYKDIKLLITRDTSSLFLYRQWLFLEKCLSPYVGISHLLRGFTFSSPQLRPISIQYIQLFYATQTLPSTQAPVQRARQESREAIYVPSTVQIDIRIQSSSGSPPPISSRLHHPTTLAPPRNKSGNRRAEETDLRLPDSPLISGRHYRRLIAVAQRECDHTPIALRILRIACYELRLDGVIGCIQQVLYTEPHREGTETISPLKGEQ